MPSKTAKPDGQIAVSRELCHALWRACLENPDKLYSQDDLLSLNVIPDDDIDLLVNCLSALHSQRRFTNYQSANSNTLLWKAVREEDVDRYQGLSPEEAVVLSHIDSSQQEGIWVRHIRSRSNLPQTNVNNALKKLEQRRIIKQVTSAKYPTRKHYMLAHLQPSEDVTGGPFFTNGALDEDFVVYMSDLVYKFIAKQSWEIIFVKSELAAAVEKTPLTPGFNGYPTVDEITKFINDENVSKVGLDQADIKQLLDLLCWDGRITQVGGGMRYKSVRESHERYDDLSISTGFTEIPCGRCPVFEWCDEGGSVNSKTCAYLTDWLERRSTPSS